MKPYVALLSLLIATSSVLAQDTLTRCVYAEDIISEANKYIGTPYRWGGKTPKAFDCAGFVRYVYGQFGLPLAFSSRHQYKQGVPVPLDELSKGDLVFFSGRKISKIIGHVGIVVDVDNNGFSFIHAANTGVSISHSSDPYYRPRLLSACRLLDILNDYNNAFDQSPPFPFDQSIYAQCDTILTLALVGDIMLGTTYPDSRLPDNDGRHLFDDVRDILLSADISVGNLEGVLCSANTPCVKSSGANTYAFRMPSHYASRLADAGFDFLSLANNHTNDFGISGQRQTISALSKAGIRYAGLQGIARYDTLTRNGVVYGFCAFGHNNHTLCHSDTTLVGEVIRHLRKRCDILIVSFHGGAEGRDYQHIPLHSEHFLDENRGTLRLFAHHCIDNGADIVFGHGPHVCRAMEVYKGHLVAYSLGNFCTPVGMSLGDVLGYAPLLLVHLNQDGVFIDGKIFSFVQEVGSGPKKIPDNRVSKTIRSLTFDDFTNPHLTIDDDGYILPPP